MQSDRLIALPADRTIPRGNGVAKSAGSNPGEPEWLVQLLAEVTSLRAAVAQFPQLVAQAIAAELQKTAVALSKEVGTRELRADPAVGDAEQGKRLSPGQNQQYPVSQSRAPTGL